MNASTYSHQQNLALLLDELDETIKTCRSGALVHRLARKHAVLLDIQERYAADRLPKTVPELQESDPVIYRGLCRVMEFCCEIRMANSDKYLTRYPRG